MQNINDYSFVDCLMLDFTIDKTASWIELVTEAYYPISELSNTRKKGRLKIKVEFIRKLNMEINEEFKEDVLREYSNDGSDYKANEVYSIDLINTSPKETKLELKSDFLKLNLICKAFSLIEID